MLFWGWWWCQWYDGEESQCQSWKVCSFSHVCLYSLPGRWTLFKLHSHITLPHWDFMQGSGTLKWHPAVPLSDGQWLQSTGAFTEGQMGTSYAQSRRHGNSAFLISKLSFHLGLIQMTLLKRVNGTGWAPAKYTLLYFSWFRICSHFRQLLVLLQATCPNKQDILSVPALQEIYVFSYS